MRPSLLLACAVLGALAAGTAAAAAPAKAPVSKARDWTRLVRPTPGGGFVMGNPNARVKLVEYGSLTCPHCGAFEREGVPTLVGNYVKSGQVSWEFRNYVRDALDISASLIARCNGAATFFPMVSALYAKQAVWTGKIEAAPEAELKAAQDAPVNRRFLAIARIAGLPQLAAAHGLAPARGAQCLTNEAAAQKLVDIDQQANAQYPDFPGTPTFILNGKMLDKTATWDVLEPQLKAALGTRG